jgi:hypothetical protein
LNGKRTSDTGYGFFARQISDMDESIVERCEDVSDAENELALSNLGTEGDGGFFSDFLLGGLLTKEERESVSSLQTQKEAVVVIHSSDPQSNGSSCFERSRNARARSGWPTQTS